jgi:hypothetical protein
MMGSGKENLRMGCYKQGIGMIEPHKTAFLRYRTGSAVSRRGV